MELMQPTPTQPSSRTSRSKHTESAENVRSLSPTKSMESPFPRPESRQSGQSVERRPRGPRCPSPLPSQLPRMLGQAATLPSMADELAAEMKVVITPLNRAATEPTVINNINPIPRGTPRTVLGSSNTNVPPGSVEPLSIKKKISTRSSPFATPTPQRRSIARSSPSGRTPKANSPRRVSPQVGRGRALAAADMPAGEVPTADRLLSLAKTTKEDVRKYCNNVMIQY